MLTEGLQIVKVLRMWCETRNKKTSKVKNDPGSSVGKSTVREDKHLRWTIPLNYIGWLIRAQWSLVE